MEGKRILSSALAAMIVMGAMTGCGSSAPSQAPAGTTTPSSDASAQNPEREKITVKVLKAKQPFEADMSQMEVFKVMGEKFNIEFEFDNPPKDNFTERLNLVMMETENLPDVIIGTPMTDIQKFGESNFIIPLNDVIADNMPNLTKLLNTQYEGVEEAITYSDGNIYYLPMLTEVLAGNNPYIVRTDWLKQLGLSSPVTIAEWENFWKLVKETDLNGNGSNDELPFAASNLDDLRNFCTAWGVVDDFYTDPEDGGKVHYGPIENGYKDALTWLNSMYEKGYIDPEIITIDGSAFSAKLAQNMVASYRGYLGGSLATQNTTMPETVPGFRVDAAVPPKGPEGHQIQTALDSNPVGVAGASITTACKNKERVAEWLDYMYSEEGIRLMNFGVEGKTYTLEADKPVFNDFVLKNPDGLSPKYAVGTFSFIVGDCPSVSALALSEQIDDESVVTAKKNAIIPFVESSQKYILPKTLTLSSEQDEIRRTAMADIDTYVDEMVVKFITGREPLSNWDAYVAKVKSRNIDDVIAVYQAALDSQN